MNFSSVSADFFFNIGDIKNIKTYKCYASAIASFSPIIQNLIKSENNYSYSFTSIKDPNCVFEDFIKLINRFEIDISIKNVVLLNEVSKILQVEPLFKETDNYLKSISKTPETIINLLTNYCQHGIECPEIVEEVVTKWEEYKTILTRNKENEVSTSKDVYEYIFSQDKFQQKYSETLFDTIIKLIEENGQTYSSLFSYCDLSKLTSSQFDKIIEIISFDSIPHKLIDSLEMKFIQGNSPNFVPPSQNYAEIRPTGKEPKQYKFVPIYDDNFDFKGVFFNFHKTNFDEYVKFTCGGDKQRYLNTLFEYDSITARHWDNFSQESNKSEKRNAWIIIYFPSHKLKLDDYTFVTDTNIKSRPKSWIITARNNNDPPDVWVKIEDKRLKKNENIFANKDKNIKTFPINGNKSFYSQFKIQFVETQGCKKSSDELEIALCGLEFYGTLVSI